MTDQASMAPARKQARQTLPAFRFQDGTILDLHIGYWTIGELNPEGSNAILLSHGASGNRDWALPFCRPNGAFDPAGRFLISADLPGGGESSRLRTDPGFPKRYTLRDLTNALAGLLDSLKVKRNAFFCGVSVSTLIGFDLAAMRPDLIGGAAMWNCGVKCDGYAQGVIDALVAIMTLDGGPAGMSAAVKAFYPSLTGRDMLAASTATSRAETTTHIAKGWISRWSANEILARYVGTISGDVTALHGGEAALARKLACPLLLLSSSSDQLLPAPAIAAFAKKLPHARVEVCPSDRGHQSTSAPVGSPEFEFYDSHTSNFFNDLEIDRRVSRAGQQDESVGATRSAPSQSATV